MHQNNYEYECQTGNNPFFKRLQIAATFHTYTVMIYSLIKKSYLKTRAHKPSFNFSIMIEELLIPEDKNVKVCNGGQYNPSKIYA